VSGVRCQGLGTRDWGKTEGSKQWAVSSRQRTEAVSCERKEEGNPKSRIQNPKSEITLVPSPVFCKTEN